MNTAYAKRNKIILRMLKSGRIYCNKTGVVFSGKYKRPLKYWVNEWGYPCVTLNPTGKKFGKTLCVPIHRVIILAFAGNYDPSLRINHKNGDKKDNRLKNLELVTCKENTAHGIRTGLINQIGESNKTAKLKDSDIRAIRKIFSRGGITFTALGKRYGVTYVNIRYIVQRKTWKHVS